MSVTSTMARRRLDVADWGCELPPEVVDLIFGFADLDLLMALGTIRREGEGCLACQKQTD